MPPKNQTLKKVGLLKEGSARRKTSPSTDARPTTGQFERVSGAQKEAQNTTAQSSVAYYAKRALGGLFLMGILALLWAPKPKLITYSVAGRSVQSVYWEFGAQGEGGRLLDVNYLAYLNEERRELSLCSPYDETQSKLACAKYAFQSVSGTLPALYYLLTHPTL